MKYLKNVINLWFRLTGEKIGMKSLPKVIFIHLIIILPLFILKALSSFLSEPYFLMSFTTLSIIFLGGTQWASDTMSLKHERMLTFFKGIGAKYIDNFYRWKKAMGLLMLSIILIFPLPLNYSLFSSFLFFLLIILFLSMIDIIIVNKLGGEKAKTINVWIRILFFIVYQLISNRIWVFGINLEEITYNLNSIYLGSGVVLLIFINFYILPIPKKRGYL